MLHDGHEILMHNVFKVNSMILVLRHNVKTGKPKEIIELYYQEMGKGTRYYDQTQLSQDDYFPATQIQLARSLVPKIGGRVIPSEAVQVLITRQSQIETCLQSVPSTVSIMDKYQDIPWSSLESLFSLFRVPYIGITRFTKMLHKKRPNIVPILDKEVRNKYLQPLLGRGSLSGVSDPTKAVLYIQELKKDVDINSEVLTQMYNWKGKPYPISIPRILDIVVWCRFGPFRDRFIHLYS
jgi:hypothetical protein